MHGSRSCARWRPLTSNAASYARGNLARHASSSSPSGPAAVSSTVSRPEINGGNTRPGAKHLMACAHSPATTCSLQRFYRPGTLVTCIKAGSCQAALQPRRSAGKLKTQAAARRPYSPGLLPPMLHQPLAPACMARVLRPPARAHHQRRLLCSEGRMQPGRNNSLQSPSAPAAVGGMPPQPAINGGKQQAGWHAVPALAPAQQQQHATAQRLHSPSSRQAIACT